MKKTRSPIQLKQLSPTFIATKRDGRWHFNVSGMTRDEQLEICYELLASVLDL